MFIRDIFDPITVLAFARPSQKKQNRVLFIGGDMVPSIDVEQGQRRYITEIFCIDGKMMIVPRDSYGIPEMYTLVVDFSQAEILKSHRRRDDGKFCGDELLCLECYEVVTGAAIPKWAWLMPTITAEDVAEDKESAWGKIYPIAVGLYLTAQRRVHQGGTVDMPNPNNPYDAEDKLGSRSQLYVEAIISD